MTPAALWLRFWLLLALGLGMITLPGCASVGRTLADKRTVVACKLADSATTYDGLSHGAVERNPFMPSDPEANFAVGALLAWILWKILPEYDQMSGGQKFIAGVGSVVFCGAAVNNYRVGQKQRDAGY